jgi:hypothetical protein
METTETSLLILNVGVCFEQMGNADAESTVAPLPGKMATLASAKFSCIRVRNYLVCFLPADADQVLTSKDDGRITFSAGWKEFELRALQEAAAPLPEPQCVFEHWPDQLNADPLSLWILGVVLLDQGRWLAFIKIQRDCDARVSGLLRNR